MLGSHPSPLWWDKDSAHFAVDKGNHIFVREYPPKMKYILAQLDNRLYYQSIRPLTLGMRCLNMIVVG